jgi:hypothetical protein
MSHQIHTYPELRQQIHDDLRLQHPDWVEPNGESPICDSYEARLTELINALTRTRSTVVLFAQQPKPVKAARPVVSRLLEFPQ